MFWIQATLSFLTWIGIGVFVALHQADLQIRAQGLSRGGKIAWGTGGMVGGLLMLFAPLDWVLAQGGMKEGPMSALVWLLVTLCGLGLVAANTVGMTLLASVARDRALGSASDKEENGRQASVTEQALMTSSKQDLDS